MAQYDIYDRRITSTQLAVYGIRLSGYTPGQNRFVLHGVNANFEVSSSICSWRVGQAGAVDPAPVAAQALQEIPGCSYVDVDVPDVNPNDLSIDIVLALKTG
jgi:hypothetical protein